MRKSFSEMLAERRGGDKGNKGGGSLQEAMQRGVAASEAGDKQAAYTIFQHVTTNYPNAIEAWVWLGWTSPSVDGAEAAFSQARSIDPNNEEAALGLRWAQSQRESAPAPAPDMQPVWESEAEPAQSYTEQRQPVQTIQSLAPPAPQPSNTATQYAQSHALPDLTPRKSTGPDVDGMMQQGIEAVRSGDKSRAYGVFERLASIQSSNADVWVWMGGTSSNMDEAEHAFRRAYDLDRNNEKAILGLRWVALRRQTMQQATEMGSVFGTGNIGNMPLSAGTPTEDSAPRKEGAISKFFKGFREAMNSRSK